MGVWYTTRETVKGALDFRETARNNAQIDDAIETASRDVENDLHRDFYPWTGTRYFDWPSRGAGRSWRLRLDRNELVSVSALVAGGTTIPAADYFLRRSDGRDTAPYTHIEIDLDSSSAFSSSGTHQRAIAVTGVWSGAPTTERAGGALAEELDASETAVDVTNSAAIGIGSLIRVDTERMIVTGKSMLTTGQTIGANLAALNSDTTVAVTTGSAYAERETILIDAERMVIEEIAGNNLIVRRAADGSVLAAHTAGATVFAPRTLTVERGAVGTTAATHSTAAAIAVHVVPGPVASYSLGLAVVDLLGQSSGYARAVGAGENARDSAGADLAVLAERARIGYGRQARTAAI